MRDVIETHSDAFIRTAVVAEFTSTQLVCAFLGLIQLGLVWEEIRVEVDRF